MQTSLCEVRVDEYGRELQTHGTALFPIAVYHDDISVLDVAWHWHEELEAVVVAEGTAVFAADGERVALAAGEGCLINANALHAAWNTEDGTRCRLHSLVFHPRLIGGGAESIYWQKYVLPLTENPGFRLLALRQADRQDMLDRIETAWTACAEEPPGFEFTVRGELSQLILSALGALPPAPKDPPRKQRRDEQRMKQMLQYIRAHLAEELTVREIAAAAAVSESECIRCFRKLTGTTPIRYVIQLRLQRAAELLRGTEDKIAEIGAACGFQEMSYFARAFRRQYGATPSAYRAAR